MKKTLRILLSALMFSAFPMMHAADGDPATPVLPTWTKPTLLEGAMPAYPEAARRQNIQGRVIVEALLMEDGRLIGAEVIQTAHPLLDRAALQALAEWEFHPAQKDGEVHWAVVRVPMHFTLTPSGNRGAVLLARR